MRLTDVQWILGHAHLSTTELYLNTTPQDAIDDVLAHYQRRAEGEEGNDSAARSRPRCATGRRPWTPCSGFTVRTAGVTVIPAAGTQDGAARAALPLRLPLCGGSSRPVPSRPAGGLNRASRDTVVSEAMACPYAAGENDQSRYFRRLGVLRMLDWLEVQPGSAWQDRWHAGCRGAADEDWRDTAERWLKDTGRIADGNRAVGRSLGGALGLLIGRDVTGPDLGWLLASATPAYLPADMARVRELLGFAALEEAAGPEFVSVTSTRRAMLQVAVYPWPSRAAWPAISPSGTASSCWRPVRAPRESSKTEGTYFYQLLHAASFLPVGAPPRAGMLNPRVRGQLSAGQLIDRYDLACRPVRDLLAGDLNERRPGIDYVTLNGLAYQLGLLFWKDLETHHPGSAPLTWHRTWRWRGNSGCSPTRSRPRGPGGERSAGPGAPPVSW